MVEPQLMLGLYTFYCGHCRYIEGVFEELDWPTEFYYNASTKLLFYYNNGTGAPLPSTQVHENPHI